MTKWEFLDELDRKLSKCPKAEVEERLNFYSESIDDRMEEGMSEEEAVSQLGAVDEVASQIIADIPLTKIIKEKMSKKGERKGWEIALLIAGSPIWLSLLISAFAVVLSLYVSAWAVVVAAWAAFVSFIAGGVAGVLALWLFLVTKPISTGVIFFACGLASAGLAILTFFACKALTVGMAKFTKTMLLTVKRSLVKKEEEV